MYVSSPGVFKFRSEGNGITHIGLYGINAIPDITKIKQNKIAIWGDSCSEAWQVDDNKKMSQILTKLCAANDIDLIAFNIGLSGNNTTDYYFSIPKIEHFAPSIKKHYILLTALKDTLPDPDNAYRSVFLSDPEYRLAKTNWKPKFIKRKAILEQFKLGFVWNLTSSISQLSPRFKPGISTQNNKISSPEKQYNYQVAWNFLLNKLKEQTDNPIAFVYCPLIPIIKNNQIQYKDENKNRIALFKEICATHNVEFIDMTGYFINEFKKTNKFPRGFCNTKIDKGHFNETGHRLIAEAILNHIN
ncbi:MAG: hypothetical protein K8R67_05505 [Desulfobacteraceae bacterium]|nr:hypothetical protein [Desulfobacteraceae bacterium]